MMKNLMKNYNLNNLKLGIKKGLSIPTLPSKIDFYYSHPSTRILRVIGGFIAMLVLTKNHTSFSYPLDIILMCIAIIQLIQIVIISIIKVVYSIRKIIKNPEEFEVRNSPLNR